MASNRTAIQRLLTLVRSLYPDWDGFDHPGFHKDEIGYKQQVVRKAAETLSRQELQRLLDEGRPGEVIPRVRSLATNLLYVSTPSTGDLALLYDERLDPASFIEMLIDLLHGPDDSPERLERFVARAREKDLPVRWPLPTYLLFLSHPDHDYFVKPGVTRWFLESLGLQDLYSPEPTGAIYAAILGAVNTLMGDLGTYNPRDMVDIQSFIWVAHNAAMSEPRCWKIAPDSGARMWEECRDGGFIAIGWEELGDVGRMSRREFEDRRDLLLDRHRGEKEWTPDGLEQVWKFAQVIREGDKIVANKGTSLVLGIGTVRGPYAFVPDTYYGHRLPVEWEDTRPRPVQQGNWRRTLLELSREQLKKIQAVEPQVENGQHQGFSKTTSELLDGPGPDQRSVNREYPLSECARETGLDAEILRRWVAAVHRKGQAILYGPPGTGKTHLARKLARHLVGGNRGFVELVQFHPSYSYEEFIQGIRPEARPDGGLDYPLRKGRFLEFCERASELGEEDVCVLIVDEINRANLSRVFGELMFLLEYRDEEVPLAGGRRLRIPANVRLLGTMNTADRSIALVDHALRRRFAFLGLRPDFDILRRFHQATGFAVEGLVSVLQRLNADIRDPHYEVGITFFLRQDLTSEIEDIWRMEIVPYLEEYFFDQPAKVEAYRWEQVQRALEA